MTETDARPPDTFMVLCLRCDRAVIVQRAWVGREVKCPHCASGLRVPEPLEDCHPVRAQAPSMGGHRRFNFPCERCGSLLEGHTGMCGATGRCPTCGSRFVVPYYDARRGRVRAVKSADEPDREDPTPLHAYAASGGQAPKIVRRENGTMVIQCPGCNAYCAIDADSCRACGAPFTMEAAPTVRSLNYDARSVGTLFLGIAAVVMSFTWACLLPAAIGGVLGLLSLWDALHTRRWPVKSVIGLALIVIALAILIVVESL